MEGFYTSPAIAEWRESDGVVAVLKKTRKTRYQ
jgi:hypothetical protein